MANQTPHANFKAKLANFDKSLAGHSAFIAEQLPLFSKASDKVEASWSGSWIGWHSRMYYLDFEKPDLRSRFSIEWGGIHMPDGWNEKTPEEVLARIKQHAGKSFNYEGLEKLNGELHDLVVDFIDVIELAAPDKPSKKVQKVLDSIYELKPEDLKKKYIRISQPGNFMTRDQGAMMEGIRIPAIKYYEGIYYETEELDKIAQALSKKAHNLAELLDERADTVHVISEGGEPYVSSEIIQNIKDRITPKGLNFDKLLRLIYELNSNAISGNAYAVHALIRAILDHTPPILGYTSFDQVAANYPWGRTDAGYMKKLADFRLQGDDALHRSISNKQDLTNMADIPPKRWLTVYLQECVEKM